MVSVVIPVFNTKDYILESINSVINQSYKDLEIIIVDDASTDGSIELVGDIIESDARVKLIHHKINRGLSAARNTGLYEAKGKYIYFLDSDDYIEPNCIKICIEEAERSNADLIMFDADTEIDGNLGCGFIANNYDRRSIVDNTRIFSGREFASKYYDQKFLCSTWRMFFKKEYLTENKLRFLEGAFYEDNNFYYECMLNAKRIKYVPRKLYHRRYRSNSIMATPLTQAKIISVFDISLDMIDSLDSYYDHSDEFWLHMLSDFIKNVLFFIFSKFSKGNEETFHESAGAIEARLKEVVDKYTDLCLKYGKNINSIEFRESYEFISIVVSGFGYRSESINYLIEHVRDFQRRKVFQLLSSIDEISDEGKNVGFYGTGKYTDYVFDSFISSGGDIRCDYFFIESDCESYCRRFRGKQVVNVSDVSKENPDVIIILSTKYNQQMLRTVYDCVDSSVLSFLHLTGIPLDCEESWESIEQIKRIYEYPREKSRKFESPRFVIVNTPDHRNIGDYMIIDSIEAMIDQEFPDSPIVKISRGEIEKRKGLPTGIIQDEDIVVIGGGGYFGNLWSSGRLIPIILDQCKDNRTIVFPQSVFFGEEDRPEWIDAYKNTICNHTNLSLCIREKNSYERAKEICSDKKVFLMPDTVLIGEGIAFYLHYMKNQFNDIQQNEQTKKDKYRVCVCLREDKESLLSVETRNALKNKICADFQNVYFSSMHYARQVLSGGERGAIIQKINDIAAADIVITDALHCMITCIITGTPCIAVDNISGKLSGTYEWVKQLRYIKLLSDPQECMKMDVEEWLQNVKNGIIDNNTDFKTFKGQILGLLH